MPKDDIPPEIRKLMQQAAGEWPDGMSIELGGPGPFEFPLLSGPASALTGHPEVLVLQLQTKHKGQQVFLPIEIQSLATLKMMIDHAIQNLGLGQKKH